VATQADVVQAKTQLKTTQAQAIDVGVQRAQLEHAIAILMGQAPETFTVPALPLSATPPAIPVGVPSELLERRPDIAAAERRVAAANAQIGVAVAAFYPTITLNASSGFESSSLAQWFTAASRFWSVGPGISQTVFDGGLRHAQTDAARAAYDATVATYRQTRAGRVLGGGGQPGRSPYPRGRERRAGRGGESGAEIRRPDHEPVQGRHRHLPERDHRPDDRPDRRDHRDPDPRPAHGGSSALGPSARRWLDDRRSAITDRRHETLRASRSATLG
jgi:hypothetical protein